MSDTSFRPEDNLPDVDGSQSSAVGPGNLGEQRAGKDPTAQDGTDIRPTDKPLAYDPDEEHRPQAGEQGGQPNLSPDPAVAGRRSNFSPGSTDDSPGTVTGGTGS